MCWLSCMNSSKGFFLLQSIYIEAAHGFIVTRHEEVRRGGCYCKDGSSTRILKLKLLVSYCIELSDVAFTLGREQETALHVISWHDGW